jgi:Mg-chelatase subunit ChlD
MRRASLLRRLGRGAIVLALAGPAAPVSAADEPPAVARPRLAAAGGTGASGTVFFVRLPGDTIAAVGAAHSYDLAALAAAGTVDFHLGASGRRVATSERFLAPPGRPFEDAEGALSEDLVVFALTGPPQGARALEPATSAEIRDGERVRILGVPAMVKQDEDDLFGRIASVDDDRIDVDLDVKADLRGWGGAPVLSAKSGRVIGVLEAALPKAGTFRVGLAPIHAVLDSTEEPLEGGVGARFAGFAPSRAPLAPKPPPHPAASPPSRREETIAAEPEFRAGEAADVAVFEKAENELEERLEQARASDPGADRPTEIELAIDYPADESVFDSPAGAFIAGSALAARGDRPRFDVVLVLDTSFSTGAASNADVNGNGVVGSGGVRGLFGMGSDPGDSILAAEVAAARRLLTRFDRRNVRVGVVTFAGRSVDQGGGGIVITLGGGGPNALTESPLTHDFEAVDLALQRVQQRGPEGDTHMAAGLDQATIELLGLRGALSETDPKSEKLVVFLTDGIPTLPTASIPYNIRACLRAADRAKRKNIKVHTFALGPEALAGPIAVVDMARHTGGVFTPIVNPGDVVSMIEGVNLVDLDSIRVRNLTTQKDAPDVETRIDGGFGALVELAPGKNRVEVVARATDGTESREVLTLHYAPGAPLPPLPPSFVPMRNALLERRLAALKQIGLGIEREQTEKTRREIALAIEEQRRLAEERAAQQRRELRIDAEPATGSPAQEPKP